MYNSNMKKFNQDRRPGGFGVAGKKTGFKRKPWDVRSISGDRGEVVMHDTVCADCGNNCRVPFRPNGEKPVYCVNCFSKRGGGRELGRFAGLAGSPKAAHPTDTFSTNDLKTQLAMINIKLDKALKLLESK
jgi:CxxC-x17-CxxC domain-containing protein